MKDIVEKILKEEDRAGKILQDAKEEAERIVKEAKKEKENIVANAIAETESFANKEKEKSEKKFISEKNKVLEEAKKEALFIRGRIEKNIPGVSKKVFSGIITIKD